MRDLIIDTSTSTCSIALFDNQILKASYHEYIGRGHAELLIPEISKVIHGQIPNQIFVNVGPGSFTGIRIGISAARALSLAWNIKCYGYSTMQLIAATAIHKILQNNIADEIETTPPLIDIIMTGGHGEYYVQTFNKDICPTNDIVSLSPDICKIYCTAPFRAGDKADIIVNDKNAVLIETLVPDTRLFQCLQPFKTLPVKPLYIRPPDAKKQLLNPNV